MNDTITVFVNDRPVRLFLGMKVKHALIAADQELYRACRRGASAIEDEHGFLLDLEGSVYDGARIYVREETESKG